MKNVKNFRIAYVRITISRLCKLMRLVLLDIAIGYNFDKKWLRRKIKLMHVAK